MNVRNNIPSFKYINGIHDEKKTFEFIPFVILSNICNLSFVRMECV